MSTYYSHIRARNALLSRIETRWVEWYSERRLNGRPVRLSDVRECAKRVECPTVKGCEP